MDHDAHLVAVRVEHQHRFIARVFAANEIQVAKGVLLDVADILHCGARGVCRFVLKAARRVRLAKIFDQMQFPFRHTLPPVLCCNQYTTAAPPP